MHALRRMGCRRPCGLLIALAAAAAFDLACSRSDDGAADTALQSANHRLVLEFDGVAMELPLERLDIYLTEEDEYPEAFELFGPDVMMAGDLPAGVRVDYEANWNNLLHRPIPIAPEGGSHNEAPKTSMITLPDLGKCRVVGGSFIVDSVGKGGDARTPLQGTCTIRYQTFTGEKELHGKFTVDGTTWG